MKSQTQQLEEEILKEFELKYFVQNGKIPVEIYVAVKDFLSQSLNRLEKQIVDMHCACIFNRTNWIEGKKTLIESCLYHDKIEKQVKQEMLEEINKKLSRFYIAVNQIEGETIDKQSGFIHKHRILSMIEKIQQINKLSVSEEQDDTFTSKNGWEDYEDPTLGKVKINTNFGLKDDTYLEKEVIKEFMKKK